MPTVFDLANAFLSIESMSNKKLQKLCYYAKAWYLALNDENLIKESFEAWVHGPVNPCLYEHYEKYGMEAIPAFTNVASLPVDLLAFARQVYDAYGHLDAFELEAASHEDKPWLEARGDKRPWQLCNTIISEDAMKNFYRQELMKDVTI